MPSLRLFSTVVTAILLAGCSGSTQVYETYESYPVYEGEDLGVQYKSEKSTFKIWSPNAAMAELNIYPNPLGGDAEQTVNMDVGENGIWTAEVEGDWAGFYYTFRMEQIDPVTKEQKWSNETPGLYATTVGKGGVRGYIVKAGETEPEGWNQDQPLPSNMHTATTFYRLPLADSGWSYAALPDSVPSTGSADVGLSGVLLANVLDFSVADTGKNPVSIPHNYLVPEGDFSSDPWDPAAAIRELRQAIMAYHANRTAVYLEMDFQGSASMLNSTLNNTAPGYFYKLAPDSTFAMHPDQSFAIDTSRPMLQKIALHAVRHWVTAYHLDGIRLYGQFDPEFGQALLAAAEEANPSVKFRIFHER